MLTLLLGAASVSNVKATALTDQEIKALFKKEFPNLVVERPDGVMGTIKEFFVKSALAKQMDIAYGIFHAIKRNDAAALGSLLYQSGDTGLLLCCQVKNAAGTRLMDFIVPGEDGNDVQAVLDEAIDNKYEREFVMPNLIQELRTEFLGEGAREAAIEAMCKDIFHKRHKNLHSFLMFKAVVLNDAAKLQEVLKASQKELQNERFGNSAIVWTFKRKGATGKQFADFAVKGKDGDEVRKILIDFCEKNYERYTLDVEGTYALDRKNAAERYAVQKKNL